MKNLIYKELKLSWHPMIFVFIVLFPFMVLIPTYPTWIGFIYVCSCYPILFLGTNKGQQSNDLIYTALLPVRKKDIVLARIFSLLIMLGIAAVIMGALTPISIMIKNSIIAEEAEINIANGMSEADAYANAALMFNYGLPTEAFLSMLGFALLAFAAYDYFFLTWFYRNGKSVLLSTLLGMLFFIIILLITTIGLPLIIPGFGEFCAIWWVQLIIFAVCASIFAGVLYAAYRVSVKNLEKVNL